MAANSNSLQFSAASSQYGDAGNISALNGLTTMTIEFWLKVTTMTGSAGFVSRMDGSVSDSWSVFCDGSDSSKIDMTIGNATNDSFGELFLSSTGSIVLNTWAHHAFVFDGSQTGNANRLLYYKDTVLTSGTFSGTIPANLTTLSQAVRIAVREGTSNPANCIMDEVRIWTTARTAGEIAANWKGDVTGATGLNQYWKFNDGSGTTATAATGQNITLVNTPTWSADVPFANYAVATTTGAAFLLNFL